MKRTALLQHRRRYGCHLKREGRGEAMRRRAAEHPSEAVGARLREMMPWIAEGRLVDKSKN